MWYFWPFLLLLAVSTISHHSTTLSSDTLTQTNRYALDCQCNLAYRLMRRKKKKTIQFADQLGSRHCTGSLWSPAFSNFWRFSRDFLGSFWELPGDSLGTRWGYYGDSLRSHPGFAEDSFFPKGTYISLHSRPSQGAHLGPRAATCSGKNIQVSDTCCLHLKFFDLREEWCNSAILQLQIRSKKKMR